MGALSIDFLVATAESVLDSEGVDRFHLVGRSMGGLTALLLAERMPDRVLSLTDIEGNLAPEDCFLSRQVLTHPEETDEAFLEAFARRVARSAERSSALYATSVQHKVRPGAVPGIFSSMVELSDHGRLLERFLALPMATSFVHGEQSSALTYLPRLARAGVSLMEISHSGHWPMYANPVELWQRVAAFVEEADPR
ncbi:alpha/beta fold hydrolase [Aeromicrobium sp. UC242_57]|uniref:alpha/beta fold hydrolase n=1 Tax=Aeromicrobium sp. UC242_57 TaxID=3374624 RepID=UPI0037A12000